VCVCVYFVIHMSQIFSVVCCLSHLHSGELIRGVLSEMFKRISFFLQVVCGEFAEYHFHFVLSQTYEIQYWES
jgi:hypothetical protein